MLHLTTNHLARKKKGDDKVTALVLRDKSTRTMFAHICTQKGAEDTWLVKKVLEDLDYQGPKSIFIQHSPAYDAQSNGVTEHAVQEEYMGQFRRLKIA